MFLKLFFIIVDISCSLCCRFNMLVLLRHSWTGNLRCECAIIFVLVAETLSHLFYSTLSLFVPLQVSFICGTLPSSGRRL
jgi:hypothetical protein